MTATSFDIGVRVGAAAGFIVAFIVMGVRKRDNDNITYNDGSIMIAGTFVGGFIGGCLGR